MLSCIGIKGKSGLSLAREIGDYNPFSSFNDYIDLATNLPKYTPEEAQLRNNLIDRCFEICAKQDDNFIYLSLVIFEESRDTIAYMQPAQNNSVHPSNLNNDLL
jgi:hypothetical protein